MLTAFTSSLAAIYWTKENLRTFLTSTPNGKNLLNEINWSESEKKLIR